MAASRRDFLAGALTASAATALLSPAARSATFTDKDEQRDYESVVQDAVARLRRALPCADVRGRIWTIPEQPGIVCAGQFVVDLKDGTPAWAQPFVLTIHGHGWMVPTMLHNGDEILNLTRRDRQAWTDEDPTEWTDRWLMVVDQAEQQVTDLARWLGMAQSVERDEALTSLGIYHCLGLRDVPLLRG